MSRAVPPVVLGASEPISLPSFIPNPETGLLLRIACRNRQSSAVASTAGAALTAAGAVGAGKPFCRQPKGRAFSKTSAISGWFFLDFPKSGQFRTGKGKIAAILLQTFWKVTRLQQSCSKLFGKREDCSNPAPNFSESDKIAAIRSTRATKEDMARTAKPAPWPARSFPPHHCRQSDEFSQACTARHQPRRARAQPQPAQAKARRTNRQNRQNRQNGHTEADI